MLHHPALVHPLHPLHMGQMDPRGHPAMPFQGFHGFHPGGFPAFPHPLHALPHHMLPHMHQQQQQQQPKEEAGTPTMSGDQQGGKQRASGDHMDDAAPPGLPVLTEHSTGTAPSASGAVGSKRGREDAADEDDAAGGAGEGDQRGDDACGASLPQAAAQRLYHRSAPQKLARCTCLWPWPLPLPTSTAHITTHPATRTLTPLPLSPADNTSAHAAPHAAQAPAPQSAPMPVSAPPPVLAPHSAPPHAAHGPPQLKPPGMASLAVVASLPSIAVPAADTSEEVDVGRAIVTQKTVDINNMEDGYKWRKWVARCCCCSCCCCTCTPGFLLTV